jgi:alpha-D-xyloside xylohydrolase
MQGKMSAWHYLAAISICATQLIAAQTPAKPTGLDGADQMVAVQTPQNSQGAFAWTELQSGVQVRAGQTVKNILFYGPKIVRVNTNLGRAHTTQPSLAVIAHPAAIPFQVRQKDGESIVSSAAFPASFIRRCRLAAETPQSQPATTASYFGMLSGWAIN